MFSICRVGDILDIKNPMLTAWLLIQKYGDNAVFIATTEADRFLEAGDQENLIAWKSVCRAIGQLSQIKKPDQKVFH
jgi:hypothetical protein